jgi:zinc and cadmium transporter
MIWLYAIASVFIISLISLVGIIFFSLNAEKLRKILIYFVSFSAGALFGDAFLHLLPHIVKEHGFTINISLFVLFGIIFSFIIEKFIHWKHCHGDLFDEKHVHPFAIMNLVGDAVHNIIDGLIIGASFLASISTGIATSFAILFHEIPQEIGDFGILLQGGFKKTKALLFNFLIALSSILGVVLALILGTYVENITYFLIPFAAGNFIYIAGADLIPELHKDTKVSRSLMQLVTFIVGILIMVFVLLIEH